MSSPQDFEAWLSADTVAIAQAIAYRQSLETEAFERIMDKVFYRPHEPITPEARQAQMLGSTTLLLVQVEDPTRNIPFRESFTQREDDWYAQQVAALSRNGAEICVENLKTLYLTLANELEARSSAPPEDVARLFAALLDAAREVAREHGTDVADVYIDDTLYLEAARRAYTPEMLIERYESINRDISTDALTTVQLSIMGSDLFETDDRRTSEDATLEALEMQFDPGEQDMTELLVETLHEVNRQFLAYQLATIWGVDVLRKLWKDNKDLMPHGPIPRFLYRLVEPEQPEPTYED